MKHQEIAEAIIELTEAAHKLGWATARREMSEEINGQPDRVLVEAQELARQTVAEADQKLAALLRDEDDE